MSELLDTKAADIAPRSDPARSVFQHPERGGNITLAWLFDILRLISMES